MSVPKNTMAQLVCLAVAWLPPLVALTTTDELSAAGLLGAETKSEAMQCGIEASGPLCLGSRSQVVLPPAMPKGLVGFWSFDKSSAVDHSGNENHGTGTVLAGPSMAGQGSSAFFHHFFLEVPGSDSLRLNDFSFTFWVYLIEDKKSEDASQGLRVCSLVRKGLDSQVRFPGEDGRRYAAAPAILYDRLTKRLRVELLTTTGEGPDNVESFETNARLRRGRWFHIALVRIDSQRMTRMYINGVLDDSHNTKGFMQPNREPLYVGGDALSHDLCNLPLYLDELRVYNRPLTPDEIQAEAAPALAGIEPSFVRLACFNCPLQTALQNCPDGYHLCNSLEMHIGGYQVARSLGWLQKGGHVWSHAPTANSELQQGSRNTLASSQAINMNANPTPEPAPPSNVMGLGLCCANS